MEYERKDVKYDSYAEEIKSESDKIDEMYECDMLHEITFREFLSDVKGNKMPEDYFNGLYIREIDYSGMKVVFVSLTGNEYNAMKPEEIRSIEPGKKGRMKIMVEHENTLYFAYKDKEEKYYYQRFFD